MNRTARKKERIQNRFLVLSLFLLLSSFIELMTRLKINFAQFGGEGVGSKRQKKYLLKGFTSGSQLEERESLSRPDSWQGELFMCL